MKKILLLIFFTSFIYADEAEKFFYERGYENGWNKGYDLGIQKGIEIAKKVIEKYKDNIKAFEIGKYLIEEKKLTYPQIYQIIDPKSGVLSFEITPSRIESELNIDDIFAKFGNLPTGEQKQQELSNNLNNSVLLNDRDSNTPDLPDSTNGNIIYMNVKKNFQNENILRKANLVYEEDKEYYRVMFFNPQEKKDFCSKFSEVCSK